MSSTDVGKLASEANAKEVLLSHLPHFGDHQDLVKQVKKEYDGNVHLASSGWTKSFIE